MSISSAFIAQPIATSLLMAGILLVGTAAYPLIPVAPLPQVDFPTAINAASKQLPKNLPSPPTYHKVNPADSPILVLALTSDTMPMTEVDDYAENILDQHISQISGVANVEIGDQQKPTIRIQIDP